MEVRDDTFAGRVGLEGDRRRARRGHRRALDRALGRSRRTGCGPIRRSALEPRSTSARRASRCGRATARSMAPAGPGRGETTTSRGGSDGFTGVFERRRLGRGRAAPAAARRVRLGRAARALARARQGDGGRLPVGTRGTAQARGRARRDRDVTHTIGVFALGLVTLLLSQYILPEDLYPVAEPRVGAAGRGRRASACCARACGGHARGARRTATHATITTVTRTAITTTITTTSPTRSRGRA